MADNPQVMVHISTPATRNNDNLYRSLADAYLAFEPYRRVPEEIRESPVNEPAAIESTPPGATDTPSINSYGSFPSQVASERCSNSVDEPTASPDLITGRLGQLERINSRWKQHNAPSPSSGNSISTDVPAYEDGVLIEDSQLALQAVTSQLGDGFDDTTECKFEHLLDTVAPPPPPITVKSPGVLPSQVTPYLEELKQQNPERFKPTNTARNVNLDERGHWSIDCSSWSGELQLHFWNSLQKHVSSGRLGWAVSLHRQTAHSCELGLVRLYCWAEVIEHMWLMLWLSSKGKIVGSGAKWLDSEDAVIFSFS